MTTHEFEKFGQAKKKQSEMKKLYGYKPSIMEVTGHGKHFFAVSEPKDLVRIDKKEKKPKFGF